LEKKSEKKRPLERQERRWMDNIKMDLEEIWWSGVVWIGLAQDRDKWRALVNAAMNFWVPKMLGNYRVASQLVASRVVFSYIELVSSSWMKTDIAILLDMIRCSPISV
jgi:hypothetical protein